MSVFCLTGCRSPSQCDMRLAASIRSRLPRLEAHGQEVRRLLPCSLQESCLLPSPSGRCAGAFGPSSGWLSAGLRSQGLCAGCAETAVLHSATAQR